MAALFTELTSLQSIRNYLPAVLVCTIVGSYIYNRYRPSLRDIPGPELAKWTGLWRLYDVWKGDAHHTAIELHRKYGSIVRIGPKHISVADPREISNIYGLKTGFTKTAFYPIQSISWRKKARTNLFSTRDEIHHRNLKRPVASAYSQASVLAQEDAINSCSVMLMQTLHEYADQDVSIDLGEWLQFYTFDVIGELSFGKKLGFLQKGEDVDGIMKAISGMLTYAAYTGQLPEWHKVLLGNPLFPVFFPSMETWNEVVNFTVKAVNESISFKRDDEIDSTLLDAKGDMLSQWSALKMLDSSNLSTTDIIVHLSANVFAGSDTTAIALRAIFYLLIKNPTKMEKLQREIDNADTKQILSEVISYTEANSHLPYLGAVIKEAMRLHPSVGLLLERQVPKTGSIICGRNIPGGTIVGINPWVTQYDSSVYDSPEEFWPERWLNANASPDKLRKMEQSFFTFGAGSRVCIGRSIAMVEIFKIVPLILREFTLDIDGDWKVNNKWFVTQEGFKVYIKKRSKSYNQH